MHFEFGVLVLCLIADCALLLHHDLVDEGNPDKTEEDISEAMEILRGSVVTGFLRISDIGKPETDIWDIQDLQHLDMVARLYCKIMCRTMSGLAFSSLKLGTLGLVPTASKQDIT
jgi:hypothetical protein